MNNHRITITKDSGSRVSERAHRTQVRFPMGYRTSCSCGWTEKSYYLHEAEGRGERHQQRPDKSVI